MTALCIHTVAAPDQVQFAIRTEGRSLPKIDVDELNQLNVFMVERSVCDTKATDEASVMMAESTLQLLPYMVLRAPSGKLYHYSRGKGGAEDRLKKNTSVGVGGHVDAVPPANTSLYDWLRIEASREIQEEVGVAVSPAHIEFTNYIVDRTNPVGRVHLGLFAIVDVPDEAVKSAEPDMLVEDGFFSLNQLSEHDVHAKLENWSQMLINYMVGYDVQQQAYEPDQASDTSFQLPA